MKNSYLIESLKGDRRMKSLIKTILTVIVLTFMFVKVYVPLMNDGEKTVTIVKKSSPLPGQITNDIRKLRLEM